MHLSFVKCRSFDDALVLFRASVQHGRNPTRCEGTDNGGVHAGPAAGGGNDEAPVPFFASPFMIVHHRG